MIIGVSVFVHGAPEREGQQHGGQPRTSFVWRLSAERRGRERTRELELPVCTAREQARYKGRLTVGGVVMKN